MLGRKLITVVLAAILIAASARVVLWGLADIYGLEARRTLAHWEKTRRVPAPAALASAAYALSTACRLDGENADVLDDRGRLAELKAFQSSTHDARTESLRALDYYRQSVGRRPTWPYTWVNIVGVKYRLAELDREFFLAIERAAILGPWEPAVQLAVADVGLGAWTRLPEPTRVLVADNLRHSVQRQATSIARIAERHQRVAVVSRLVGQW